MNSPNLIPDRVPCRPAGWIPLPQCCIASLWSGPIRGEYCGHLTNHSSPGHNTHPLDQSERSIVARCFTWPSSQRLTTTLLSSVQAQAGPHWVVEHAGLAAHLPILSISPSTNFDHSYPGSTVARVEYVSSAQSVSTHQCSHVWIVYLQLLDNGLLTTSSGVKPNSPEK